MKFGQGEEFILLQMEKAKQLKVDPPRHSQRDFPENP